MRNWRIELLRGLAAFGIVGCHLALEPRTECGYAVGSYCDMNVGLFAALSGFLMSTKDAWFDYVWRRIRRLVPVYFIWTIFFVLFGFAFDWLVRHGINPKWHRDGFIWRVVFLGDASTHLWFLACLLYAQVLASAIFRVFEFLPRCFWLVVGFCCVMMAVPVGGFFGCYFLRLFGFLLTGYGLAACIAYRKRIPSRMMLGVAVLVALVHWFGRGFCGGFILDWLLVCPILFLFTDEGDDKIDDASWLVRMSRYVGETSFGVFLIHPVVAASIGFLVRRLAQTPYGMNWVLLDWIVCWGVSIALVVFLMKRLAKVKWLIR